MKNENNFYYPSLDGLRFFAFLIVFLHHSLQNISSSNEILNFFLVIIQKNGWVGVDLFFVLSGFLITTLLLKEREKFHNFSLKNFWIRRSLRIWPLYYLALFLGFFIVPLLFPTNNPDNFNSISQELPWYLVFLGNWQVSSNGYSHFSNISHLWTISLEEQFYFFWPIVLLFITGIRSTFIIGLIIILISLISRFILASFGVNHPGIYTNTLARIDTLTIGGLIALILFFKPEFLIKTKQIFSFPFQFLFSLILLIFLHQIYLFDPSQTLHLVFGYLIISLMMAYFVISITLEQGILSKFLSFKLFVWLGKISFGLYVWHILAIESVNLLIPEDFRYLKVLLSLLLSIIFGFISYNFYEVKFLKLKNKFSRINSRPI